MFRLGWQVVRARFREDVSPKRVRRAVMFGIVVGVLAGVVLGVTAAHTGWAGAGTARSTVVVISTALAAGLLTMSCFPVKQTADPPATINGRQVRPDTMRLARHSVQRYLRRRMPQVLPEDRDAVLQDTAMMRRTLVVDVVRASPGLTGLALLALAALVVSEGRALNVIVVAGYTCFIPTYVVRLGRAERAHRAAAALPPTEHTASGPAWNRFPSGSKIDLPGS
ncbi:hypothetical protein DEJ34_02790 [Curtobacterium sp. MCPF17_050]|uniref:hypothetical protein n=1 Tax=Curtobacterium sp. MCPF17_050 TaxID=2175664 RepID=UPI000D9E4110|nr:hypothetical protein [Curtobacterium sp. MCPF17_050]WIB16078.1 hypothetical protein DEJ34_02790 [Curtobacterium sp. MCPF17_050]